MKKGIPSKIRRDIRWKVEENGCFRCVSHSSKCIAKGGYPQVKRLGKLYVMSRYLYEEKKGKIPNGLILRHKCDNKWCINVDHLETGTYSDNLRDAYERGQYINYGERNHQAKISFKDVLEIKKIKGCTLKNISERYGIGISQVHRIRNNLSWQKPLRGERL